MTPDERRKREATRLEILEHYFENSQIIEQGMLAYAQGLPLEEKPPELVGKSLYWEIGWHRAKAFITGAAAKAKGHGEHTNPFPLDPSLHQYWLDGYNSPLTEQETGDLKLED